MTFLETLIDVTKFIFRMIALGIVAGLVFVVPILSPILIIGPWLVSLLGLAAGMLAVVASAALLASLSASLIVYFSGRWRFMYRFAEWVIKSE